MSIDTAFFYVIDTSYITRVRRSHGVQDKGAVHKEKEE